MMAASTCVLYVDDEPDLLNIGKLFLEQSGEFSVTTAISASEALKLLEAEKFDAIISDYQMPGMDGIQFLVEVRTRFGSIPFILFTGRGREEVVIQAINSGVDFYIQKGGEPAAQFAELINKIRYAVERRNAEKEASEAGERYKALIAVSNTGAWEYYDETGYLWCSPEYFSMLGRDASQYDLCGAANLKETWIDLIHPADRKRASEYFTQYLQSGSIGMYENHFRMQHSDGHWIWILSRGSTLRNKDGILIHKTVGTHIDVTGRILADDALRTSEGQKTAILDGITTNIAFVDKDLKILWANRFAAESVNKSPAEMVGYTCHALWADPARPCENCPTLKVFETKQSAHIIQHTPDDRVWDERGEPVFDEKGNLIGVVEIARDITGQKQAEEALQRQSASLSILNDIITTANKADDLQQLLTRILSESLRLLDFDAGGIYLVDRSTRTANIVQSKNLPPEFLAEIRTVSIDKKPFDMLFLQNEPFITDNYAQINPDLSKKYGFLSMASIPLLSKEVAIGALNIASMKRRVISKDEKQMLHSIGRELGSTIERMAAEEEIKRSKKNFETLFNSIDEMVFVLDMQGHILVVNDTVLKYLSYTSEELTGMDVLLLHVPERREEALRNVQGMIAGTIDSCPVPVLTKDGIRIEVETKVTRGLWNGSEVLIGVTRDITERKHTENALALANKKLTLLSGITRHDITNQLTVLVGYLTILKKKQPDPALNEYFVKAATAAQRISSMIQFTREYEKIGVNVPVWQDTRTLVDTAAKEAPLGKVVVKNDLPAGTEVFADPLVVKVVYNLMDNAVRYGGKITTIRFSSKERDEDHVVVCEDDGDGIPVNEKDKIFDRGFGKNTGLGLALSREILDITGITINETGEPGKGARFEIAVPKGMYRS